jgi:hypothetical protein
MHKTVNSDSACRESSASCSVHTEFTLAGLEEVFRGRARASAPGSKQQPNHLSGDFTDHGSVTGRIYCGVIRTNDWATRLFLFEVSSFLLCVIGAGLPPTLVADDNRYYEIRCSTRKIEA